jgi:hypothetical protein
MKSKCWIFTYINFETKYTYHEVIASEDKAYEHVSYNIVDIMRDIGADDPTNDYYHVFNKITNFITNKKFFAAIAAFNDFQDEEFREMAKWIGLAYHIVELSALTEDAVKVDIKPASNYPNGMTCIKCSMHNQYAVPNQKDSTYKCRGCSIWEDKV